MEAVKGGLGGNGVEHLAMVAGVAARRITAGSGADDGEDNTDGDRG